MTEHTPTWDEDRPIYRQLMNRIVDRTYPEGELLVKRKRTRFLREEWPSLRARIRVLDIDPKNLLSE